MAVKVSLIAHQLKLGVLPYNHNLPINPFLTAALGKKPKFRLAQVRNPA